MRVDFRSVCGGDECTDLVGGAIKGRRLALRGTVEQIDEGPTEILGIDFESCAREQCEQIGPDAFERLNDGFANREICAGDGGWTDRKSCEIETCELVDK